MDDIRDHLKKKQVDDSGDDRRSKTLITSIQDAADVLDRRAKKIYPTTCCI